MPFDMERKMLSAPVILAILLLAAAVIGEVLIETSSHSDFRSDILYENGGVYCSVEGRGSHIYDVLVLSDGYASPDSIYIYYDETYESKLDNVSVAVGARALDQKYYVDELVDTLKVRGLSSTVVNARELGDIVSESGNGVCIICISGALPDTVYDGIAGSNIVHWIESGGRLFWAGNVLGKYVSHTNGIDEITNGTSLFLGTECIDDAITDSYQRIDGDDFGITLSLINNQARYGVKASDLPGNRVHKEIGYTDGERSSLCIIGLASGCIYVFGGDYSDYQRIDIAQVLASGLSPTVKLKTSYSGSINTRFELDTRVGDNVYVYYGGDLTIYGQLHEVVS